MADQASLNNLLKWGIENSSAPQDGTQPPRDPSSGLNPQMLAALLGGPSDADLMREAMTAIAAPEVDLENKLIAFDNFEQLIENLDNANNMENLGLWMPLTDQLKSEEAELRRMAAWCCGTAVQNNIKSQERVSQPCRYFFSSKRSDIVSTACCRRCNPYTSQPRDSRPHPSRTEKGNPCIIVFHSKLSAWIRCRIKVSS